MKKLLAVLLTLCLAASMPLLAMATTEPTALPLEDALTEATAAPEATEMPVATDAPAEPEPITEGEANPSLGTTADSEKIAFTFQASLGDSSASEQEEAMTEAVLEFANSIRLEMLFAEADGLMLMDILLFIGDDQVGTLHLAFDTETMYVSGDMLPPGWISVDMQQLSELLGEQFDMDSMMAQQEAAMQSALVLLEQLFASVQNYMTAHPEIVEQMPLESLPKGMDPAIAYTRLNITKEMYPEIYRNMDAALRDLAAKGELNDLDGKAVTAENYDSSTIGQLMAQVLDAMDDTTLEGVVDILSDAQNGVPGLSIDLTVESMNIFLILLRQTAENGEVAWNGEFEMVDEDQTGRIDATIQASSNAPDAEMRRFDASMIGEFKELDDGSPIEGSETATFSLNGTVEYPGENAADSTQLFQVGLAGNLDVSATEGGSFSLEFIGTQGEGASPSGNVDTNFSFIVRDGAQTTTFASTLGVAYEKAEGLSIPNLAAAKIYPVLEMSPEEQTQYMNAAQGTALSFLFKVLSKLPPTLQGQFLSQ